MFIYPLLVEDAFIPVTRGVKGYLYSGKCIYQVEECVSDPRLYAKYVSQF